jgi:hypothetical protein
MNLGFLYKTNSIVIIYLASIVAANLIASFIGPGITIVNAFLFIGLDLTARDRLHECWRGKRLYLKMLALIFAGSLLSFMINKGAANIAIASFVAFLVAGAVDFVVYSFLQKKGWMVKSNGSNVFSAFADSIIFPTIAFGSFLPLITLGQFAAKTFGGFVWTLILRKVIR